jgi:hypothetical protein
MASVRTSAAQRFSRLVVVSVIAASTLIGFADAAGAVPVPFKNCGQPGDAISIQSFNASVWPPQRGKPLTLTYRWNLGRDVAPGGTDSISMTPASGHKLKDMLMPRRLKGHLPAGPRDESLTFIVPRGLRPGSVYVMHRVAFNADGTRLLCMDLTVPIK